MLQAGSVKHCNVAPAVLDQAGVLQLCGSFGHPFTAYAQHVRDQLLRHHKLAAFKPVQA